MPITVQQNPMTFSFDINGFRFVCQPPFRNTIGKHPLDILIGNLEDVIKELKSMERFEIKDSSETMENKLGNLVIHNAKNCALGCPDDNCEFKKK